MGCEAAMVSIVTTFVLGVCGVVHHHAFFATSVWSMCPAPYIKLCLMECFVI
jgi:hypothetical protein